jgi:hypothetical protein
MAGRKKAVTNEIKRVVVEAVENRLTRWIHRGKEMLAGDMAEVSEEKAARLKDAGLVK